MAYSRVLVDSAVSNDHDGPYLSSIRLLDTGNSFLRSSNLNLLEHESVSEGIIVKVNTYSETAGLGCMKKA